MSNQSTAKIDSNDKPTIMAYNETTSAPEALRCESIFNSLEIVIANVSNGTYTSLNRAKIDANDNATILAYNETTGLMEALRCDSSGNLLVKYV